ncbi:hypothetical protein ACIP4W_04130 [Streptomyces sp. NPDC088846]
MLAPQVRQDLLTGHSFTVKAVDLLQAPEDDNPVVGFVSEF